MSKYGTERSGCGDTVRLQVSIDAKGFEKRRGPVDRAWHSFLTKNPKSSPSRKGFRYAENIVDHDDAQLKLIAWGDAGPGLPSKRRASAGTWKRPGWIFLDWKKPVDGGRVAAYKIQRRALPEDPWADVGLALESEITLTNQEREKCMEYRVTAVNKAGEGPPSNAVSAVL